MAIENHLYNQMILAFRILIYHFGYIHPLSMIPNFACAADDARRTCCSAQVFR
jgi:hypothetical protein